MQTDVFGKLRENVSLGVKDVEQKDWLLATFKQRCVAWALEMIAIPLITLTAGGVGFWIASGSSNLPTRLLFAMGFFGVVAVNVVWWVAAMRRGQSPGKQIVGLRVVREDGSTCGFWYMALREVAIKGVMVGSMAQVTFGAAWLLDYLWLTWDRSGKKQTLHDKLLGTLVVEQSWPTPVAASEE